MGRGTQIKGQMDTDKGTDGHQYGQMDTNKGTDGHRYGQMDTNMDRWTQIWE